MADEPDKVWLSREEYEHLRQLEQAALRPSAGSGANDVPPPAQPAVAPADSAEQRNWKYLIGLVAAIGLYLSLTSSFFNAIFMPILVILIIYAVVSLIGFLRHRQQIATTASSRKRYKTLFIILAVLIGLPILAYGAMIAFFVIALSMGGGIG